MLTDTTKLKQAEEALLASEARLNAIFDASPDPLLITDAQGIIAMVNQQVERLLGFSVDELIGQPVDSLLPDRFRPAHPELRARYAASPHSRRMGRGLAVKAQRKDGTECEVEVSLSRIETEQGLFFASALRDITEQKRIESALRESESRYRRFTEELPLGVVITQEGLIKYVNPATVEMIGYNEDELLNKPFLPLVCEADRSWLMDLHRRRMLGEEVESSYVVGIERKDGQVRQWQAHTNTIEWGGKPASFGSFLDITERKQVEADLRIAAAAFEAQEAIMVTDANTVILRVNRAFTESTGYTVEEIVGQTPRLLKSDRHSEDFYREMWESINRTGSWKGEIWDRRKNGEDYPKWLTISAVKGEDGAVTHYIGTHFDITERKKAEQRINDLAFFDQLTGLPNRTLLLDRLKQTMAASSRSGNYGALLFIDLDNFKTLNDTLGHDMGDQLLQQVAMRLKLCVREGDTVARFGGDEFVVVLSSLSSSMKDAASSTEVVAEKILAKLNQPYQLGNVPHNSSASIGATSFLGHTAPIDELMKQADLAMYKSKAAGRNLVRFFDPTLEIAVKERVALEEDLRRALDEKQFLLHYQAQIVDESRVTGAEVLVRWQHPRRGMVSPADFIPLAEDTGLILPLGQWVLETACNQLAAWSCQPEMTHLTVAVNVSAHQFRQPDFVDQVLALIERTGVKPQQLKLELTESMLVHNVEEIIAKMILLKTKGVGFSLDDFGTGYSSLSYLKRLPLDQLKIDKSFVRDVLIDTNDAAIARTVVALAQNLGLGVIAEGVETAPQRDFLASSGCHAYQGYFFSRPLPVESFEAFVRRD
ncbi:MAG: EAL domain-containing protein [Betaproteobacteria bacterium]|nr:EAL domain-containing protein [Betaproteobacteria bacterium]